MSGHSPLPKICQNFMQTKKTGSWYTKFLGCWPITRCGTVRRRSSEKRRCLHGATTRFNRRLRTYKYTVTERNSIWGAPPLESAAVYTVIPGHFMLTTD